MQASPYSHHPPSYLHTMPPPPPTFVVVQPPMSPFGSSMAHQYVLPTPMPLWWHDQYLPSGANSCQTRIDYSLPPSANELPYCESGGGPIFPRHK